MSNILRWETHAREEPRQLSSRQLTAIFRRLLTEKPGSAASDTACHNPGGHSKHTHAHAHLLTHIRFHRSTAGPQHAGGPSRTGGLQDPDTHQTQRPAEPLQLFGWDLLSLSFFCGVVSNMRHGERYHPPQVYCMTHLNLKFHIWLCFFVHNDLNDLTLPPKF